MLARKYLLLSGTALSIFMSSVAYAQTDADNDDEEDRYDPTYQSFRIASVDTEFSNIDRAFNLGFTLGIRIPGLTWKGTEFLSAEIDLSSTIIPGENSGGSTLLGDNCDDGDDDGDGGIGLPIVGDLIGGSGSDGGGECRQSQSGSDLRMNTVGLFARARSPGRFFGAARVGYRFIESSISDLNDSQTGAAWSLGAGYQYSPRGGAVELVYSQYGSDVNLIELSVSY